MLLIFYANILFTLSVVFALQISTPQGDISGTTKTTLNGREVYAFLGIPFAKPPVGELRFKNPVPFGSWEGVRNGTIEGESCLQASFFTDSDPSDPSSRPKIDISPSSLKIIGSEDCLYLNVVTPNVDKAKKYPVMVNIHGGGFVGGSGTLEFFGPDFLLDKDVVLVSLNYRVGALGFASTEDAELSGNWGLKDQALALQWVQENIAAYGGNPDSVTIFGASAGGASVDHNVISPLSKGLFHRAIAMGGAASCPWAISLPGVVAKRTRKLASFFDCPTEPSSLLVDCFRKIKPERFIEEHSKFVVWDTDPFVVFTPVVEPKGLDGAFLTESPDSSKSTVPMIIGVVKDEGAAKLLMMKPLEERLKELDENFEKYGPSTLLQDSESQLTPKMLKEIRKFYFSDKNISKEELQSVADMYSDCWFVQGALSAVRRHEGPTYLYKFTYRGSINMTDLFNNEKLDLDFVYHGEDSIYIFPLMLKNRNMTENDRKMLDTMVTLWTNFAIHGNPTPKGSEVVWNQVSKSKMNYLNLDVRNLKMTNHFFQKREYFWQQLFQKKQFSSNNKNEL